MNNTFKSFISKYFPPPNDYALFAVVKSLGVMGIFTRSFDKPSQEQGLLQYYL